MSANMLRSKYMILKISYKQIHNQQPHKKVKIKKKSKQKNLMSKLAMMKAITLILNYIPRKMKKNSMNLKMIKYQKIVAELQ